MQANVQAACAELCSDIPQAIDEHGKVATEETLLDQGDFVLLLVDPSERPDIDEAPLKEFAQINDAIGARSRHASTPSSVGHARAELYGLSEGQGSKWVADA